MDTTKILMTGGYITIGNKTYQNIKGELTFVDGQVMVNDRPIGEFDSNAPKVNITIHGDVKRVITTSGEIVVEGNVTDAVTTSGDISAEGRIRRAITTSGNIYQL